MAPNSPNGDFSNGQIVRVREWANSTALNADDFGNVADYFVDAPSYLTASSTSPLARNGRGGKRKADTQAESSAKRKNVKESPLKSIYKMLIKWSKRKHFDSLNSTGQTIKCHYYLKEAVCIRIYIDEEQNLFLNISYMNKQIESFEWNFSKQSNAKQKFEYLQKRVMYFEENWQTLMQVTDVSAPKSSAAPAQSTSVNRQQIKAKRPKIASPSNAAPDAAEVIQNNSAGSTTPIDASSNEMNRAGMQSKAIPSPIVATATIVSQNDSIKSTDPASENSSISNSSQGEMDRLQSNVQPNNAIVLVVPDSTCVSNESIQNSDSTISAEASSLEIDMENCINHFKKEAADQLINVKWLLCKRHLDWLLDEGPNTDLEAAVNGYTQLCMDHSKNEGRRLHCTAAHFGQCLDKDGLTAAKRQIQAFDIVNYDGILIPIQRANGHADDESNALLAKIVDYIRTAFFNQHKKELDTSTWVTEAISYIPDESNLCESGLHILFIVNLIARNKLESSHSVLPKDFAKKVLYEIIKEQILD